MYNFTVYYTCKIISQRDLYCYHEACGTSLEVPSVMDDCPRGLVKLGYLRMPEIWYLRDHGARAWIPEHPAFNDYYAVFVEPWMLDMRATYKRFKENGTTFAGLSEWEFVLSALPETISS